GHFDGARISLRRECAHEDLPRKRVAVQRAHVDVHFGVVRAGCSGFETPCLTTVAIRTDQAELRTRLEHVVRGEAHGDGTETRLDDASAQLHSVCGHCGAPVVRCGVVWCVDRRAAREWLWQVNPGFTRVVLHRS